MGMDSATQSSLEGKIYFLCNPEQRRLLSGRVEAISKQKDYQELVEKLQKPKEPISAVVILLELKWTNRYYTDFLGLDLLFQLRFQYNIGLPIILTSHLSQVSQSGPQGFKLSKSGFQYFQDPSVDFRPLKELQSLKTEDWAEVVPAPLDDSNFHNDLKENLYQQTGYLEAFFDHLIDQIRLSDHTRWEGKAARTMLEDQFSDIQSLLRESGLQDDIDVLLKSRFKAEQHLDKNEIEAVLLEMKRLVSSELVDVDEADLPEDIDVLYIQSKHNHNFDLSGMLLHHGVRCRVANDVRAAIRELDELKAQVICCDFRFYDEQNRFSWKQGYHIIRELEEERPDMYFFIVLTNYPVQVIPRFFRRLSNVLFIRREHLQYEKGLSRLVRLIWEKDQEITQSKVKLPAFKDDMIWYIKHQRPEDYLKSEKKISDFAINVVKEAMRVDQHIPHLVNLQGTLGKADPEESLRNFRNRLKARRAALALYQLSERHLLYCKNGKERWAIIYSILMTGAKVKNINTKQMPTFLSRHLYGLKTRGNYYWGDADELALTKEEREWLDHYGKLIENETILEE